MHSLVIPTLTSLRDGRYKIKSTLTGSLFGSVFKGVDTHTDKHVAIKVSSLELMKKGQSTTGHHVVEDVRREAAVMRRLSGAHAAASLTKNGSAKYIAELIDEFEEDGMHVIVTEFARGGDLFSLVAKYGRMTECSTRVIFKQVVQAVNLMHELDIAHVDLSTENICIGAFGHTKIIDMGQAAVHPSSCGATPLMSSHVTMDTSMPRVPGTFACTAFKNPRLAPGKHANMSHELLGGMEWDAFKNDTFSLGVILFTMLTGRQPFRIARDDDHWFRFIYHGKWVYQSEMMKEPRTKIYRHLSPSAMSLINALITPQEERLSTRQILVHPWITCSAGTIPMHAPISHAPCPVPVPVVFPFLPLLPSPPPVVHPDTDGWDKAMRGAAEWRTSNLRSMCT